MAGGGSPRHLNTPAATAARDLVGVGVTNITKGVPVLATRPRGMQQRRSKAEEHMGQQLHGAGLLQLLSMLLRVSWGWGRGCA